MALSKLEIEYRIFVINGSHVMIDRDLAEMYGVEVKRLNEQMKRNIERFPESFRFQLRESDKNELVANCDRFESLKISLLSCAFKSSKKSIPITKQAKSLTSPSGAKYS